MSHAEVRACIARLGLSQSEAARLMGVGVSTFQRWCADPAANKAFARRIPPPAARLLWAMERMPKLVKSLREYEDARPTRLAAGP